MSTPDPAGSRDFYADLLGWAYRSDPGPGGSYVLALCGGQPVAGLAPGPIPHARPAAWTLYLATARLAHTAAMLVRRGGLVLSGPVAVSGQGQMLLGQDPAGGVFGVWEPETGWMFRTTHPGALFWAELNTWDGARADEFYAALFGYRQRQIGNGGDVDYTVWSRAGRMLLGRIEMNQDWAAPGSPTQWLPYFTVSPLLGTDAAAARVCELGGRVGIDPYDTEFGRIARVSDPTGAAFALIDPTTRLPTATDLAAGPARVDDPYDD